MLRGGRLADGGFVHNGKRGGECIGGGGGGCHHADALVARLRAAGSRVKQMGKRTGGIEYRAVAAGRGKAFVLQRNRQ